jgi:hypothetical protein
MMDMIYLTKINNLFLNSFFVGVKGGGDPSPPTGGV